MSNLTRYEQGGYDCGQTCTACGMEVSAEGEYVKFDDIKELLNSSHNSRVMPCLMYAGVGEQCDVLGDGRCGSVACQLARA